METEDIYLTVSGGWTLDLIHKLANKEFVSDSAVEGKNPTTAFFHLLIRYIECSPGVTIRDSVPHVLKKLNLPVPENLSTFVRSVRRCVKKAEKEGSCEYIRKIPECFTTNKCLIPLLQNECKITEDWLLHGKGYLAQAQKLTFEMLMELSKLKNETKSTSSTCATWVKRIMCLDGDLNVRSLERKIEQVTKEKNRLRGNKEKQQNYLNTIYTPTLQQVSQIESPSQICTPEEKSFPTLSQLSANILQQNYEKFVRSKVPVLKHLDTEIISQEKTLQKLHAEVEICNSRLQAMQSQVGRYAVKNVYRRDKRHEEIQQNLKDSKQKLIVLQSSLEKLKIAKENSEKLLSKYRRKAGKRRLENTCFDCIKRETKIARLKEDVRNLEWENTKLISDNQDYKDKLKSDITSDVNPQSKSIPMKEGKHYNSGVRTLWMELLSLGVAVGKVGQVVKKVIEGLTDRTLECLPSKGFASQIQTEAQIVSQFQMADAIRTTQNSTLHLDGTKKKFREYGSFQLSLSDGTSLCLGIEEMVSGEARTYMETVVKLFEDIAQSFCGDDQMEAKKVTAELLAGIKNTMTDRSVVNTKFVKLFEEARHVIFENNLIDYTSLSSEQQQGITKLNSLYCGLHILTNLGTSAKKALLKYEEISLIDNTRISEHAFSKGNARSFDLIFEASQALTRTGNQRSGCASNWEDFLDSQGDKNFIESFLHHRFNVLFTDGAAIYYHRNQIFNFLNGYNLNENKLLLCIKESILSPICQAATRALGIFAELVTVPLWILLEKDTAAHILSLNSMWLHLQSSMKNLSVDSTPLLHGASLFPDVKIEKTRHEKLHSCLFEDDIDPNIAALTKDCLELICFEAEILLKRQLQDQLPGGIYHNPTEKLLLETTSCPTSNRIGERDFSDVDRDVTRAPQKTTAHHSSSLTFRNNRTADYLRSLNSDKRKDILHRSIKLAPLRRIKNRAKLKNIKQTRQKLMEENKLRKEAKLLKAASDKDKLRQRINELGGPWASGEQMENILQNFSLSDKTRAVKDQILYLKSSKYCIRQKSLWSFSVKGKPKSLDELRNNFLSILNMSVSLVDKAPVVEKSKCRDENERAQLLKSYVSRPLTPAPVAPRKKQISTRKSSGTAAKKLIVKARRRAVQHLTCQTINFTPNIINSFIAVGFEDKWYLGQITDVLTDKDATVKYMTQVSSKVFKWPETEDIQPTKSVFVVSDLLSVFPRDSGLRFWEIVNAGVELKTIWSKYEQLKKRLNWY